MPRTLIDPVPLYVAALLGEIGIVEDTRPSKSLARIEKYHGATRGGEMPDHVAWCSSLLCYCFERAGYMSTRSKSAASWITWGIASTPRPYVVTLFPRSGGSGYHVALSLGLTGEYVYVIGGNQSDAVTIVRRLTRDVAYWRAPLGTVSAPPSA